MPACTCTEWMRAVWVCLAAAITQCCTGPGWQPEGVFAAVLWAWLEAGVCQAAEPA